MRKIIYHPFFMSLIGFCTLLLCISLFLNMREIQSSQKHVAKLRQEVETQETELSVLEKKLEKVKSVETKEEIIRNQLLMQKPGEYVVQLPEISVSIEPTKEIEQPLSPWEKWKKLLF